MRLRAMVATNATQTPSASQPSAIQSSPSALARGDPSRAPTRRIQSPKITEMTKLAAE